MECYCYTDSNIIILGIINKNIIIFFIIINIFFDVIIIIVFFIFSISIKSIRVGKKRVNMSPCMLVRFGVL